MDEKFKTVNESRTEQTQIVFSGHINGIGRLFGGQLMEWMDVLAAVVARRHSEREVTTVSIDKVDFSSPARLNDTVYLEGKIAHVGNTSMKVCVTAYVERLQGDRTMINKAYFTMVAMDEFENPCRVPRLILKTDAERAEFEEFERKRKAIASR